MHKCEICGEKAEHEFVNPYNPNDRCYYCKKHFKGISKGFSKFEELYFLTKNVGKG